MKKILLFLFFVLPFLLGVKSLTFSDVHRIAQEHENISSREYRKQILKFYEIEGGKVLTECFATLPNPELQKFSIILSINETGKIIQTWRKGESDTAKCYESEIIKSDFPSPPFTPYYTSLVMDFGV